MKGWTKLAAVALALLAALMMTTGAVCNRRISGPSSWWDDRAAQPLPDDYRLPSEEGIGERDSWSEIINSR